MGQGKPIGACGRAAQYQGRLTGYVVFVAIAAASGGLLFGYDIGVTGGVCSMDSFLLKFFPGVYDRKQAAEDSPDANDPYCTFDDQSLALFTSSLFLAGMVVVLLAGGLTRKWGRRVSMLTGGLSFLAGGILNAAAQNLAMLYVGRMCLGVGIGFAAQSVPLYLSEMAPHQHRGAMNMMFQLATTIGILAAQLINYGVQDWSEGWRLSLGLATVPACLLTLGGCLLPESPNSLAERGQLERARAVLVRIRATEEVDAEYEDICEAAEQSRRFSEVQAWANLVKREYRPALVLAVCIPMFMQLTGINAIMFYAPVLFSSLFSGKRAALLNTVIIGVVNVLCTFVSIALVDRIGRRKLYMEGGVQMLLAQVATAVVLAVEFGTYNTETLPSGVAVGVLILICVFVAGFAWSWGPLGLLSATEVQPLETRSAGLGLGLCVNFFFSFVLGQWFLPMLCSMEWGVFLLFSGMVLIMSLFIFFLLPETKGLPLEEIYTLYGKHPFWKKVVGEAGAAAVELEVARSSAYAAACLEGGSGTASAPAVPTLHAEVKSSSPSGSSVAEGGEPQSGGEVAEAERFWVKG